MRQGLDFAEWILALCGVRLRHARPRPACVRDPFGRFLITNGGSFAFATSASAILEAAHPQSATCGAPCQRPRRLERRVAKTQGGDSNPGKKLHHGGSTLALLLGRVRSSWSADLPEVSKGAGGRRKHRKACPSFNRAHVRAAYTIPSDRIQPRSGAASVLFGPGSPRSKNSSGSGFSCKAESIEQASIRRPAILSPTLACQCRSNGRERVAPNPSLPGPGGARSEVGIDCRRSASPSRWNPPFRSEGGPPDETLVCRRTPVR